MFRVDLLRGLPRLGGLAGSTAGTPLVAAPLVTWTIYVATAYLTSPPMFNPDSQVEAMPEVYAGAPIVQALLGLLVGIMMVPDRRRR